MVEGSGALKPFPSLASGPMSSMGELHVKRHHTLQILGLARRRADIQRLDVIAQVLDFRPPTIGNTYGAFAMT